MAYKPVARWKQFLGGVLLAITCGAGTAWVWHTALRERSFSLRLALLLPPFFVMGLGLLLFPGYKEERIARGEDISQLSGLDLLTPRWWVILALSFVAAFANLLLLSLEMNR